FAVVALGKRRELLANGLYVKHGFVLRETMSDESFRQKPGFQAARVVVSLTAGTLVLRAVIFDDGARSMKRRSC
ncbi:MAG: hypothetical protein KDE01_29525, partial [Caldilineaceae bacterium]|nr:hypothetical protein [Caldilineaceae bacterium]